MADGGNKPARRKAPASKRSPSGAANPRKPARRCNDLDGKRWLLNSLSLWSDIRKSTEELRLKHPAMFPSMLAERLIESFLPQGPHVVLDPFAGTGSTLVAAEKLGKRGIGFELSPEYVAVALKRLARPFADEAGAVGNSILYHASASTLGNFLDPGSVDLCVTSPPYWNILNQRRTADLKSVRHYGNLADDLGTIDDYDAFLSALAAVFERVLTVLKAGAHCAIVVMDLRKKNRFYPFHSDLAARLQSIGFQYDDLIVWNRQSDYNNLRPLGYPAVFRVNKVHEFILLMQKPAG
ncbi:MAG TPA: site-specific DNA-methyltransferase [Planctomycetaceae bacterium]|jgi:DNA modification methylase|nr:site-specific DNA-methyltransferase [Planctomycetaceae bacterium]